MERIGELTGNDGCSCSQLVEGVGNGRNESRVSSSTSGDFSFCSLSISSNARSLALAISRSICYCSSAAWNLIFSSNMERSAINSATLAFSFIQADCKERDEHDERDLADHLFDNLSK